MQMDIFLKIPVRDRWKTDGGFKLGEINIKLLLQKIEELTLYTLGQQESIDSLKKLIDDVKAKSDNIQQQIDKHQNNREISQIVEN